MTWAWDSENRFLLCLETQVRIKVVCETPAIDIAPWHIVTNLPSSPGDVVVLAVFDGDGAESRARDALSFIGRELGTSAFSGLGKARSV